MMFPRCSEFCRTALFGLVVFAPVSLAQSALGNASPRAMTPTAGGAVFVASAAAGGAELYATNGSAGSASPIGAFVASNLVRSPNHLTATSTGLVYFAADSGTGAGTELWIADGSATGTRMVADLRPGASSSYPDQFVELPSGMVVFSAVTDALGREPWVTDGLTARPLVDVRGGAASSAPCEFVLVGSEVFFTADDGSSGRELWATDGTTLGTRRVKDIRPGSDSSCPNELFAHGGELWFAAQDGVTGFELWRSDGTASGTVRFLDLRAGPGSSQPGGFVAAFGRVYFVAQDGVGEAQLYTSDGTIAGTGPLVTAGMVPRSPSNLTSAAGRLWFVAEDPRFGAELWSSDGTGAGTAMVADIRPGPRASMPDQIVEVDPTHVVFVANDGARGRELWRADRWSASLVRELWPGVPSGRITGVRRVAGAVLFGAQAQDGAGHELFRTDGTAAGTVRLEDLNDDSAQLTLDLLHTVEPNGEQSFNFVVPSAQPAALLFAARIGPGIDPNSLGIWAYGMFGLDPASLLGFLFVFPGPVNQPMSVGLQIQAASVGNLSIATQAAGLNPLVFSGVTSISVGTWDLTQCGECATVPMTAKKAFYVDDTYEYDLDLALPVGAKDVWLRVIRVSSDGNEEQVRMVPLRAGSTRLRGQVELRRRERIEMRIHCGDPESGCWVTKVLGC